MALREFKLPDPGEGLLEAEIVEWKVAVGDTVKVNDIVVEVETAKSLVELPIPWAGTVTGLHVAVGDEVEVGTVIITIDDGAGGSPGAEAATSASRGSGPGGMQQPAPATTTSAESGASEEADEEPVKTLVGYGPKASSSSRRPRKSTAPAPAVAAPATEATPAEPSPAAASAAPEASGRHTEDTAANRTDAQTRALAKPPVRKLAKDLGIDLNAVPGSGEGGIVTRADVEAYAAGSPAASASAATSASAGSSPDHMQQPVASAATSASRGSWGGAAGERETRVPIKGVRKMTAQAMVGSAFTAPHVTEWVTVDVTATMDLVEKLKGDREFRDVKVTPMLVLATAMLLAIKRNPGINASWDEAAQEIVLKHYVNLGIAAATPRGLIVPNIKDADALTMRELADAIAALTATAREGRTPPVDMAGGTVTITNIGVFGIEAGTPILNPGESAILAFGTIARRPWVVGNGSDEQIVPRWVTTLALSFDHRLVDGELGSKFLADVAAILADPSRGLVWG